MGLFYQLPYKVKIQTDDVVSLTNQIKKIQKDTGLEFFEAIQVYELQLKIIKAEKLDGHLEGFREITEGFVGEGEFDFGVRDLSDAIASISSSLDYIGRILELEW